MGRPSATMLLLLLSFVLWALGAGVLLWQLDRQESVAPGEPVAVADLNLLLHVGYLLPFLASAVLLQRGHALPAQITAGAAFVAGLLTLVPIVLIAPTAAALLVASFQVRRPVVPAGSQPPS